MSLCASVILSVLVSVLLAGTWVFFYLQPQLIRQQMMVSTVRSEAERAATYHQEKSRHDQLASRLRDTKAALRELEAQALTQERIVDVSQQLATSSTRFGLLVSRISPFPAGLTVPKVDTAGILTAYPVEFEIVGRFLPFGRFLETLNDFPYAIRPTNLSLVVVDSLVPNIQANLTVEFLVLDTLVLRRRLE